MFGFYLNVALVMYVFVLGFIHRRKYLYTIAFLIPLQALGLQIVTFMSWYKLAFPITLLVVILLGRRVRSRISLEKRQVRALFSYITFVTIIFWLLNYVDGSNFALARSWGWGKPQVEYRYLVQYINYCFYFGLYLIGRSFVHTEKDVGAVYNGFINGNIFSIFVGLYQMFGLRWGIPRIDILFGWNHGLDTSRLYGLAGEPKHLAGFATYALCVLLAMLLFDGGGQIRVKHKTLKTLVLVAGVLLTKSTGGLIMLVIIFIALSIAVVSKKVFSKYELMYIASIVLLTTVTIIAIGPTISALYEERVLTRVAGGYETAAY